jgi:hypothetical protein
MFMYLRLIMAVALTFTSTAVLAHGSGQHVLGTVMAIDADHMEVKTSKGATVSVKLTKETRFKEKGNPKSTELPVAGDRVVIDAMKEKKVLTAIEVHFSAAKRASAPAPPAASAPGPSH